MEEQREQLQAALVDVPNVTVERLRGTEITAIGAAFLVGLMYLGRV